MPRVKPTQARRRWLPGALALLACAAASAPAHALTTCGSAEQPDCAEDPPPGVELTLSPEENPKGLQPLAEAPSPDRLLWPRVRGHLPYGFNAMSAGVEGVSVSEEAMIHEEMGASVARIAADWGSIQYFPNRQAGGPSWNFAHHLDEKYREYVRRGVRPMFVLLKTPRRFTRHADTARNSYVEGCTTSDACHTPPTAEHLDALATFAAELARRYPLAAGIEVWNEPNIASPFWGGDPLDPEHYASMVDTVHDAVRQVRPNLPVLAGAMAGLLESTNDAKGERMSMRTFLARMLRAGAADDMDAVTYHPYLGNYPTWEPTQGEQDRILFARMTKTDEALAGAYTDAGVPRRDRVVATEFGASTTDGFTEERQAAWMRLRYWLWDINYAYAAVPVDAAFIQKAVEDRDPSAPHKWGYGFVRPKDAQGQFATKQAFCAFRKEFGGFTDCPAQLALPTQP